MDSGVVAFFLLKWYNIFERAFCNTVIFQSKQEVQLKTTVTLSKLAEDLDLRNLTPEIDMTTIELTTQEINRPALQLAGYYEHFSHERVQIIGYVEYTYIISKEEEEQHDCFEKFISSGIPCVIFTTLTEPTEDMRNLANQYKVPVLISERTTSSFMVEIIRYLGGELAPRISMHGVLVDVYGEGVLITGESGIGKSEAALELVRRGHRLVSDDVVIIRKVSEAVLIGSAPDVTKHLIELRGIGIIDVRMLYGVEHVKDSQEIDLVIKLEDWNKEREYDRLGLEEQTTEILGNKVLCHSIPIRPGRNLAVIVETAAVNHRQKKMGYNAAHELYRRVQENLMNKKGV
ncbi:MAG TPA: HPr(Ser) kinase/phosphatase [Lachnospiraceae bacterium]|nr:HPr(Ser) kinase/phosphatase [Lachnospiraceae bacterium]